MAKAWAVIVAGGSGSRFSLTQDKLLVNLAGKPVLQRTLEAFLSVSSITGLVLVASANTLETYQALVRQSLSPDSIPIQVVLGGSTRRDSVYRGLSAMPESVEVVAIHDAARPLISPELIKESIQAVERGAEGAIVALPMVDTVKKVDPKTGSVQSTIDRRGLWRAQTPQTFRRDSILKAHQSVSSEIEVTDDAQLLELAGIGPVVPITGDERNLKITNPQDIWLAEAYLAN